MEDYSYIEIFQTTNSLGAIERMEYKWKGKSPICLVGIREMYYSGNKFDKESKTLQIGPYKLKQIESDYGMGGRWIGVDYPFWWLVVLWYKANRILEIIYRRTIITLAVWNLAEHCPGQIPTYKDIYLVQKITKTLWK